MGLAMNDRIPGLSPHRRCHDRTKPFPGLENSRPSFHRKDHDRAEPFPGLENTRSLLFECYESSHEYKISKEYIELKLIDCITRHIVNEPSSTEYAALSYVWGGTEAAFPEDGPDGPRLASRVCLVIEDAMKAALYLGFQYLWVDQYCVEQIDTELQARQIQQMHLVYNSAQVTLVAAVGGDANSELASSKIVPCSFTDKISTEDACTQRWSGPEEYHDCINDSVWNTRGWTYQESYISRRVIVFHKYGIYFECSCSEKVNLHGTVFGLEILRTRRWETARQETGVMKNGPKARYEAKYSTEDVMSWLTHLIAGYSQRTLKYNNDTLKALSAVLKDFDGEQSLPFHYKGHFNRRDNQERNFDSPWRIAIVKGIPFYERALGPRRSYIVPSPSSEWPADRLNTTGLCWHYDRRALGDNASSRKPDFPSWSWAGWTGPIKWRIPKLCSLYRSQEMRKGTLFHLKDIGFIENLENSQELDFHRANQAQQPLLCFSSIAFPPEAFSAIDPVKQADHKICLYEYIIKPYEKGYLYYSEGSSALVVGLQQGTHKLVPLTVHFNFERELIEFQAWILRKCEAGKSCYERVGSGYYVIDRWTKLGRYLEDLVEDAELERFNIC
ncbi:20be9fde-9019-4930-bc45-effe8c947e0d [Sclerotinia trifoliorum]|uniref:20be9fde-9019-4930-bc45-effe8c947e0d n=1 Tax=Sclerotinia trifoliorum TaxID=28548 RepID=A0A8H2VTJ4_9HELO|nr:20be9fde-9019-4930-bc45-effe8c947e0d [Sclerotinia trifoliorum]